MGGLDLVLFLNFVCHLSKLLWKL